MRSILRCVIFLPVAIVITLPLLAQFDSASVIGTVYDPTRAAVIGARLTLRNLDTGVKLQSATDNDGKYYFTNVKIGKYTLLAEAKGFKQALAEGFELRVAARQRVDLALEVGEVIEIVTVSEAVDALETGTSSRGTVVGASQILNLPLNGRAYADLALLAPGVRRSTYAIAGRDASFNVNGMRGSHNNFIIDGVDNNSYGTTNQGFSNQVVQISPDAVQEFRIETSNFSAEYGRVGGAVVNATVRSGTNEFHGSGWWFLRNTSLNSFGFFKNDLNRDGRVNSLDKPILQQHQYGGSFGGPIKKDRMFVFMDFEGFRRNSSTATFTTLPQAAFQNGDFRSLGTPIRHPLSGEVLPGSIVPVSQLPRFARDLLAALPKPNVNGAPTQFFDQPLRTDRNNKGDIRYDQYLNSKLNAFARYSHRVLGNLEPPPFPGAAGGEGNGNVFVVNKHMAFGANWTVSPTSMLDFRMGVSVTEGGKTTFFSGQPNAYTTYNIPNGPTDPVVVGGFYRQVVTGYSNFGAQSSSPQYQTPFVVNPKLNYTKVIRSHSIKSGYEYQAINTEIDDFQPKYGSDSYAGQFSRPAGVAPNNAYNLIDFMYGARSQYALINTTVVNHRQRMHFGYLQDDWKINNRLTLNLGVRYEYGTPQWEADGRFTNFDPATKTLIRANRDGGIAGRALVNPDRNNWAPRVGVAYRISGSTVFRSGYGISYIHFNRFGGENMLSFNLPTVVGVTVPQLSPIAGGLPLCTSQAQRPLDCFRTREQGYSDGLLNVANVDQVNVRVNYIPKDSESGAVKNFHVSVQRQLPLGFVLDMGYVGTRADNLMILGDFNQGRPNAPAENTGINDRRPISGFGQIQIAAPLGFLQYDSVQAKIERRQGSLNLVNSFTYSRGFDNATDHGENLNGDNSRLNFRNIDGERGYSGYDQRWNNTTTFVYELPFGKGRRNLTSANWLLDGALGGWRLNAFHSLNAGLPLNLLYQPQVTFQVGGGFTYRPNVIGNPVALRSEREGATRSRFLNSATVVVPTDRSQPFGNAFRNAVRGPMYYSVDLGLHKEFNITERFVTQFRFEAFNLLNRTNFLGVDTNRTSGTFGLITSTLPARELQFAVKLRF